VAAATLLTCQICTRPLREEKAFCEACGARTAVRTTTRTRQAPQSLPRVPEPRTGPRTVAIQEILNTAVQPPRQVGRRRIWWTLAVVLIVLVAVGFGSLRWSGVWSGGTLAERRAAELAATQAQLRPQIAGLMRGRTLFFAAERRYLPAMQGVRSQMSAYNRKLAAVEAEIDRLNASAGGCSMSSCVLPDYPAYPARPQLKAQIRDLRTVLRQTTALHEGIIAMPPGGDLVMAYSDLLAATDQLGRDAEHNLDEVRAMLAEPAPGIYTGGVSRLPVDRLRRNGYLPSVRRMNRTLVRQLRGSRIPVRGYDLPGGQDRDRTDHSTSV